MNIFHKLFYVIFIFWGITIILSYCIDWTINRNAYSFISVAIAWLMLGLVSGRRLTLIEVEK